MGKSKSPDRDFAKGYHDGRSGKDDPSPGIVASALDAVIPGPSIQPSKDYKDGYRDGKEDRQKSDDRQK